MEHQPLQSEWLNPRGRQKLLRGLYERADWFKVQLVAASEGIKENIIPLLSTSSLLESEELELLEQEHLRKMLALQAHILNNIPEDVGGVGEFRNFVTQTAGSESDEWHQLAGKLPQPWKNAVNDVEKLNMAVISPKSWE